MIGNYWRKLRSARDRKRWLQRGSSLRFNLSTIKGTQSVCFIECFEEGGKKRHSSNVEQSSLVFEKVAKLATFFHRSLPISSSEHSQSNDKGGLSGFFKMLNQVQQDQWGASVTNNRRTMGLCWQSLQLRKVDLSNLQSACCLYQFCFVVYNVYINFVLGYPVLFKSRKSIHSVFKFSCCPCVQHVTCLI